MLSRLANTSARTMLRQAPALGARSAPKSTLADDSHAPKLARGSRGPAWREPANFPDYDGWDESMENDWKSRAKVGQWRSLAPANARDGICDSVLDLVGQTPMVRMSRLCKHLGISEDIEVVAKCEFFNAGGSVKDRVGLRMIQEAEKDGRIKKGDVLIEATSGNTGIGLCMAAAVSGYKVIITMPLKMSGEKLNTMKALGAEILRTPNDAAWNAPNSHISLAADLAAASPNAHVLDQYLNAGNPLSHYEGTGVEMLRQCDGKIDVVVMAAGTGGTATGVARKIKEALPDCKIVAVDPKGSDLSLPVEMNDHPAGYGYQVEGIGYDFVPTVMDRGLFDEWVKVDDDEAFKMARNMIRHEGMMVGGSSGSCMAGAHTYIRSREAELKGKRVVVLCADSTRNYMSKFLDDKWMAEHGIPFEPALGPEGTEPPSAPLMASASAKRLRELNAALQAGHVTRAEYDDQRAAVLTRYGPPASMTSSLDTP